MPTSILSFKSIKVLIQTLALNYKTVQQTVKRKN